jgi:hypothetical protein
MPVEIRLTADQVASYEECMSKAKVPSDLSGQVLSITVDTYPVILATLKAAHAKAMLLKAKRIAALERLYNLEQIIYRVEECGIYFIEIGEEDAEATTEEALMAAIMAANNDDANPDQEFPDAA